MLLAQEREEVALPSLELIEFLGSFKDDDLGWIDPLELLVMEDVDLELPQDGEDDEKEKTDDEK